jgi:hypothetical protein
MRIGASICLAALVAGLLVAGCGDDSPDTDEEQITAVLNLLFDTQENGDADTACNEVYVVMEPWEVGIEGEGDAEGEGEAEREAEGDGETAPGKCEAVFEQARATAETETSDLSTELGEIEVDGDRATAIVHTELVRSDGSPLSQDVPYDLVHTADGWRIRISEEG